MRIALVAEDYYPQLGGVPEHVHHLAQELNARGRQMLELGERVDARGAAVHLCANGVGYRARLDLPHDESRIRLQNPPGVVSTPGTRIEECKHWNWPRLCLR